MDELASIASNIINNWPLDDWSINVEVFQKIIEILPFGSTILEFGSGKSSELLSKFYNVISIEDNKDFLDKYNTVQYIYNESTNEGYNFDLLESSIKNINYQLLIVDGPNNGRENINDYLHIFKDDCFIIWDDTQVYEKYAIEMAEKFGKKYNTYNCKPNGEFWGPRGGKKFTLIN